MDEFHRDQSRKDRLARQCKECEARRLREYYKNNREKVLRRKKEYYQNNRDECLRRNKKYQATEKGRESNRRGMKRYYATLRGYLGHVFNDINQRCNNPKIHNYSRYGGRGIQNKFSSLDDFRDYVVNALLGDIRGLQIHRMDNNGHYEPGNIEFLTPTEHIAAHVKLRKLGGGIKCPQ